MKEGNGPTYKPKMKETIVKYVLENSIINEYFMKVESDYRDDFRSHIWLIILEMTENQKKMEKITKLYSENKLGRYIVGLITNQLKSNTSSFTAIYKKKFQPIDFDIPQQIEDEPRTTAIVRSIIKELNGIYFADAILYKLWRGIDPISNKIKKPMTFKEIQELIGINYKSVRNSVMKTDRIIKERVKI